MFTPKTPLLISIQPEHVERILAGTKTNEYRSWLAPSDCNCFVIYRSLSDRGIVAVAEIGEPKPTVDEDGKNCYEYPLLKVYAFKELLPLNGAFAGTPLESRHFYSPQGFTYLSKNTTPEVAVEAVKALLKNNPYKIVKPKSK